MPEAPMSVQRRGNAPISTGRWADQHGPRDRPHGDGIGRSEREQQSTTMPAPTHQKVPHQPDSIRVEPVRLERHAGLEPLRAFRIAFRFSVLPDEHRERLAMTLPNTPSVVAVVRVAVVVEAVVGGVRHPWSQW